MYIYLVRRVSEVEDGGVGDGADAKQGAWLDKKDRLLDRVVGSRFEFVRV